VCGANQNSIALLLCHAFSALWVPFSVLGVPFSALCLWFSVLCVRFSLRARKLFKIRYVVDTTFFREIAVQIAVDSTSIILYLNSIEARQMTTCPACRKQLCPIIGDNVRYSLIEVHSQSSEIHQGVRKPIRLLEFLGMLFLINLLHCSYFWRWRYHQGEDIVRQEPEKTQLSCCFVIWSLMQGRRHLFRTNSTKTALCNKTWWIWFCLCGKYNWHFIRW